MAPTRTNKRGSGHEAVGDRRVPLKSSPSTPKRSPIKKRTMGISLAQKQALIDNLQLEITERARRLRAQYHLQAQGLRSRIEIRINRIPTSLRKVKMGELMERCLEQEQRKTRPPPVPAKDLPARSVAQKPARAAKRLSDEIAGDKENEVEHGKKRARTAHATAAVRPGQVLSPTSSNSRINNRERPASPSKAPIARPASPLKTGVARSAAATNVLSSMVEKAKATRAAGTRKVTTTSNTSSSSAGASAAPKGRKPTATSAARAPARPPTRTARRLSDSETSEGSAPGVGRKPAAAKAAAPTAKRTVMGTIRKGVAGAAGRTAPKANAASTSTSSAGRVLRKRG